MSGTIDLSQLPPSVVVEPLDFETLFAQLKAAFIAINRRQKQKLGTYLAILNRYFIVAMSSSSSRH